MVIARITGGLGNQMFQYALGRQIAVRRRTRLKLDVSSYASDVFGRQFRLDHFRIAAAIATSAECARRTYSTRRWLFVRRLDTVRPFARRYFLEERHFHFDPDVARAGRHVYLSGYWQSERYFAGIANLLRDELTPCDPPTTATAEVLGHIDRVTAVSVHVRRGDYTFTPVTRIHPPCTVDYYRTAVATIRERVPGTHFFVFSDDPQWVRANLEWLHPATLVTHNGAVRDYEDLRAMSHCRHHIIANSSFSWWAAWLCRHDAKVVVAPLRWFGITERSTRDLYPDGWLRVDG
jgi:hypothetical protein